MYQVDGSIGGGSVLRIAIPIALAQGKSIEIFNIRQSRSKPGLRPQHLKGIELLCHLTGSQLNGSTVGSTKIKIIPGDTIQNEATIDITTAGSISLVYQLLSNYTIISEVELDIRFRGGGTHTKWSPNFDYLQHVTTPALELFGQHSDLTVNKVGYYPKGGAEGHISLEQRKSPGKVELDVVDGIAPLKVISRATEHLKKSKVAERQIQGMLNEGMTLEEKYIEYDESDSIGSSLTCWMTRQGVMYRGFSKLGEKGVPAEKIGENVAEQVVEFEEPAAVDEYLADQLMLPLSQAEEGSFYTIPKITKHVTTNLDLINTLLPESLALQHHQNYYLIRKI